MIEKENSVSIEVAGNAPPSRFRIFKAGINHSRQGPVIFDKAAQEMVMRAHRAHMAHGQRGIMIDLEHLSLDQESKSYDPDARGWCELEILNGELWATHVSWTNDGLSRLTEKKQRFISPTFYTDKIGRVTRIFNIAITAIPATDHLTALIAANLAKTEKRKMPLSEQDMELAAALMNAARAAAASDDEALKALGAAVMEKAAEMVPAEEPADMADGEEPEEKEAMADGEEEEKEAMADGEEEEKVAASDSAVAKLRSELAALNGEIVKLRSEAAQRSVADLVAANANKIAPSLKQWALSQSREDLQAFLDKAPVITSKKLREPVRKDVEPETVLSDEGDYIVRSLGLSKEAFIASKKSLSERNGG